MLAREDMMSTAPELKEDHRDSIRRPRLVRREHEDYGDLCIPYYDEELDVAAGKPHAQVIMDFGGALRRVARYAGLEFLTDNPIWLWDRRAGKQKTFFADLALSTCFDGRDLADDIALIVEVVTTSHAAKMRKDTVTQKDLYEFNGIPEFVLFFPDLDDDRVLVWYRLVEGRYQEHEAVSNRFVSQSVPGHASAARPMATGPQGHGHLQGHAPARCRRRKATCRRRAGRGREGTVTC